jgi:GAF domain-containing protein
MADQIAIALENAHLFSQAQSTIEENKHLVDQVQASLQQALWLSQAGQAIAIAQDTQAIFQIVVERVLQPDIEMCWLILFDPYETASPENLEISHTWSRAGLAIKRQRFSFSTFPMRELVSGNQTAITQRSQLPPTSRSLSLWDELGPTVQTLAFLPLQAGPRWIGALALGASVAEAFAEEKLRAYQALAIQMSVAIENRRLVESAQASLQELSAVYRRATREAWATALQSKPELADFSFARPAQASGETSASSVEPLSRAASGDQVAWSVPLRVRGQEIGALELGGPPRPMSEQERTLVETVATQTALALDGARLFDETQRLAGRERLINEITARIRASTGVPGILQTAARELATAMNVPHAVARIRAKTEEPRDPRDGTDDQTAQR